jgi:hypothetical protein
MDCKAAINSRSLGIFSNYSLAFYPWRESARGKNAAPEAVKTSLLVMAGLVPAIHVFLVDAVKTWMPGTSPGMTS